MARNVTMVEDNGSKKTGAGKTAPAAVSTGTATRGMGGRSAKLSTAKTTTAGSTAAKHTQTQTRPTSTAATSGQTASRGMGGHSARIDQEQVNEAYVKLLNDARDRKTQSAHQAQTARQKAQEQTRNQAVKYSGLGMEAGLLAGQRALIQVEQGNLGKLRQAYERNPSAATATAHDEYLKQLRSHENEANATRQAYNSKVNRASWAARSNENARRDAAKSDYQAQLDDYAYEKLLTSYRGDGAGLSDDVRQDLYRQQEQTAAWYRTQAQTVDRQLEQLRSQGGDIRYTLPQVEELTARKRQLEAYANQAQTATQARQLSMEARNDPEFARLVQAGQQRLGQNRRGQVFSLTGSDPYASVDELSDEHREVYAYLLGKDGNNQRATAYRNMVLEEDRARSREEAQRQQAQAEARASNRYLQYTGNADWAQASAYRSTATGEQLRPYVHGSEWAEVYAQTLYKDPVYEYVNGNEEARALLDNRESGFTHSEYGYLSGNEVKAYNYLYAREGKAQAEAYLKELAPVLNRRQREAEEKQYRLDAQAHPVRSSVGDVLRSPEKAGAYVQQAADYLLTGRVDENAGYNRPVYRSNAVRGQVDEIVRKNWGEVGSFLYQTGMSMGDFLWNTAVTGGVEGLNLAIMGAEAASSAVVDAKDRGLDDNRAFALGTVAGAAEIVTEKVSLEALLDKTALSKNAAGYWLKNVLSEGSEEVGSDLINLLADVLISQDRSEWQQAVRQYEQEGYTQGEAFGLAARDQAQQMGLSFAGGALSGGLMAAGGIAVNGAGNAMWQNALNDPATRAQYAEQARARFEQVADQYGPRSETYLNALDEARRAASDAYYGAELSEVDNVAVDERTRAADFLSPQSTGGEGLVYDEYVRNRLSGDLADRVNRLGKELGVRVEFADQVKNGEANAALQDRVVQIEKGNSNPVAALLGHELGHQMKQDAPSAWAAFEQTMPRRLREQASQVRARYEAHGVNLSEEQALEEIACDFAGAMLNDNRVMDRFLQETQGNSSLREKAADALHSLARKLTGRERLLASSAETRLLQAMQEAGENKNAAREGGETSYSLDGKQFTEDKYFSRQVDRWEELAEGTRVKVGETRANSALNQVGLPTSGMWFDVGKIKKAMRDHNDHLSPAVLKAVPDLLNDPIVITEYKGPNGDVKNTVNVYGSLFANGHPVVVGVVMRLDSTGRNIITNIRTIHARSDVANQITDASVLYLNEDKRKTRSWFQVCGNLNVPLDGTKYGLIRSIPYASEKSNTKFSMKDNDEAQIDRDYNAAREGVWYSAKEYDPETASIKEQIENSREQLNSIDPVTWEMVPANFQNRRAAKQWVISRLQSTGYQIDRQNFGTILFSKNDIENAIAHTSEAEQQAALAALPRVLKRGTLIGEHIDHKGRGKHTITFAAPVVLNGHRGNMAVVVNRNGNHFYASQIVAPDGSVYRFPDKTKTQRMVGVQGVAENSSLAGPQNSASDNSISDISEKSNTKFSLKDNDEAQIDRDYNAAREGDAQNQVQYSVKKDFSGVVPATEQEAVSMDAADDRNVARFVNEVSAVLSGRKPSGYVILVGQPSAVLQRCLGSSNPLVIPQSAIKKAVLPKGQDGGKHGLGRAVIDELIYQLDNPLAITGNTMQHQQLNDESIVAWTDWKTKAGDSIIIPIRIDVDGQIGVYNNINTVFDLHNQKYFADLLRDGNMLYTRDGKSIDDLLSQRRQVPEVEIDDASSESMIPQDEANVNPQNEESGTRYSLKKSWKSSEDERLRKSTERRINTLARHLKEKTGSNMDGEILAMELLALRNYVEEGKGSAEELGRRAGKIADHLGLHIEASDSRVREIVRANPIALMKAPSLRAEMVNRYGSYKDFIKEASPWIKVRREGVSFADLWQQLENEMPGIFDSSVFSNEADQLVRVIDYLNGTAGRTVSLEDAGIDTEAARNSIAVDILEELDEVGHNLDLEAQIRELKHKYEIQEKRFKTKYKKKLELNQQSRTRMALRAALEKETKSLSKRVVAPTDSRHVPDAFKVPLAKLLEAVNLESTFGVQIDDETGRTVHVAPRAGLPTRRTQAFQEMKQAYLEIQEDPYWSGRMVIDPDLEAKIDEIIAMKDLRMLDMDVPQLRTVLETVRAINHSIVNADKLFSEGKLKSAEEAGKKIYAHLMDQPEKADLRGPGGWGDTLLNLDNLQPYDYFHEWGEAGDDLYRRLRDGADRRTRCIQQAADFMAGLIQSKSNPNGIATEKEMQEWSDGKPKEYQTIRGVVTMTDAQVMKLYMQMKRQQAVGHILGYGFRAGEVSHNKHRTGMKLPVRVAEADVQRITDTLSDKQKAVADELLQFTSTVVSGWGNEASNQVYGYSKFTEPNYNRIVTDKDFIPQKRGKEQFDSLIKNKGWTKSTVEKAKNPVIIEDAFDDFANHIAEMSAYHAYLAVLEDVDRIFNYSGEDYSESVRKAIKFALGSKGTEYFDDLIRDINGTASLKHSVTLDRALGNFKAAAVGNNVRVIAQQPTAYYRALAVLDASNVLDPRNWALEKWDIVKQYAPIAQWKDWGYFEINTGRDLRNIILNNDSTAEKIKQGSMWAAGMADQITWQRLFKACERQAMKNNSALRWNTPELYEAAGKLFTEMVDRTQVVDSVLHRSKIMRDTNGLNKMATAFMAEPTKSYNLLRTAIRDYQRADAAGKKAMGKKLARTVVALVTNGMINAVAQSLVDALRDDDDDEGYLEKFLQALTGIDGSEKNAWDYAKGVLSSNLMDGLNPLSWIPYVRDMISLMNGYDVERTDVSVFSDLLTAYNGMIKALQGEGKKSALKGALDAVARTANLLGIPAYSLERDVLAVVQTIVRSFGSPVLDYEYDKLMKNPGSNKKECYDTLWRAVRDGKDDAYQKLYNIMLEDGFTTDNIRSAMKDRYHDALREDPTLEYDERMKAQAGVNDNVISGWKKADFEKAWEADPAVADDKSAMSAAGVTEEDVERWEKNKWNKSGYQEELRALGADTLTTERVVTEIKNSGSTAEKYQAIEKSGLPVEQKLVLLRTIAGDKALETLDALEGVGADRSESYKVLYKLATAQKSNSQSEAEAKQEVIRTCALSDEQKAVVYRGTLDSGAKDLVLLDEFRESGEDLGAVYRVLDDLLIAENTIEKREALLSSDLGEAALERILDAKLLKQPASDEEQDKYYDLKDLGIGLRDYLEIMNLHDKIRDDKESYSSNAERATAFAYGLSQTGLTKEQQTAVRDLYKFWSQVPGQATTYDKLIDAGLDEGKAYSLTEALNSLEPEAGKETVSASQKEAFVAFSEEYDDKTRRAVLGTMLGDKQAAGLKRSKEYGISTEDYMDVLLTTAGMTGDKDASGKSVKGAEKKNKVLTYIDSLSGLTDAQKDLLATKPEDGGVGEYAASTVLEEAPWHGGTSYTGSLPRHRSSGGSVDVKKVTPTAGEGQEDTQESKTGWGKTYGYTLPRGSTVAGKPLTKINMPQPSTRLNTASTKGWSAPKTIKLSKGKLGTVTTRPRSLISRRGNGSRIQTPGSSLMIERRR